MVIELTPQNIITAASLVTSGALFMKLFANGVRRYDKQEKQSTNLEELKQQHAADVKKLEGELTEEVRRHNAELQILTYGVLACLKGLQEKGCNGPVTEAANKIERYLNEKAHEI